MLLSNKFKKNKGITLIEIIISVSLLAILFVSASSIILNMIKGNIKAENRQQAAYLGQNILDELSDDMNFTIRSDDKGQYFNLLNGEKIYKQKQDIFKGDIITKYKNNEYEINVLINKNFTENKIINNLLKYSDFDWRLSITNDKYSLASNGFMEVENQIFKDINIEVNRGMNIKINENYYDLNGEKKNMLVIYLQDEEKKEYVDIKINNKSDEIIDIYVIKENIDSSLKVSIRGKQGNVYYLPVKEEYVSGEIYGVSVSIKEKSHEDILFEGHIVSKISFN